MEIVAPVVDDGKAVFSCRFRPVVNGVVGQPVATRLRGGAWKKLGFSVDEVQT